MEKNIFSKAEFLGKVEISNEILINWENFGLLKPIGLTDENFPHYTQQSLERALKIKKLFELGYNPEEIKKIIKKIGFPKSNDKKNSKEESSHFLTVGNLAEKVGVSPRTIKHWEDKGIIVPDMRSEGGFRLYSEIYVYLCKLIIDLQLFGYTLEEIKTVSDYFRDFLTIQNDYNAFAPKKIEYKLNTMIAEINKLCDKMDKLKSGIERWKELLKKKKKEIIGILSQSQKNSDEKQNLQQN